jgi:S1-C subfamily serine protease
VTITREQTKIFGLRFKGCQKQALKTQNISIYVSEIQRGSPADMEGNINVGDILFAINNQTVNEFDNFQTTMFAISNSGLTCTFTFNTPNGMLIFLLNDLNIISITEHLVFS